MSKDTFALQYQDVAEKAGTALGVSPQALLAQWGLETGWGKSIIPGTNNLGNIKDFSGKGVEATDNLTKSRDKYRTYADASAFADDYVALIKKRYPTAVGQKTVQGFAQALKDRGYAEDPEYVRKVVQAAGEDYAGPVAGIKERYAEATSKAVQNSIIRPASRSSFDAAIAQEAIDVRIREEARPTGFEQLGAAVAGNTDNRIIDGIWGPKFEPVAGYQPDMKALPAYSDSDLIEEYATAKSPDQAAHILQRASDRAFREKTVMDAGLLTGFAMSIAAEGTSVTNWVAPFAAAKSLARLGTGSLVLAQEGRAAASVGSAITENVISGTAVEAIAQGADGRLNGQDLLVSLAADSLMGLGTGVLGLRAVRRTEALVDRAATAAIAHEADLAARATKQLAEGATAGELRKVMDSIYKEDLNNAVKDAIAGIPAERQLIKEPRSTAQTDMQVADTPAVEPLRANSRFATAEQLAQREMDLRKGGIHEGEWAINTGGKIKSADEFASLGKGVHVLNDVPREAAGAVDTLTRLAKSFLPEHTLTLNFERIPLGDERFANGAVVQTGRTGAMIRIDPTLAPSQVIRSTAHELGHVIFNSNLSKAKIKDLRSVTNAWREFAAEAMSETPDGNKARAMRFSALNVDQGASKEFTPKLKSDYELDFDEYLAEQFVKYMERDVATDNKLGLTRQVVNTLKDALARVIAFFKKFNREMPTVDLRVSDFLDNILAQAKDEVASATPVGRKAGEAMQTSVSAQPADVVSEVMTDPATARFGLTIAPVSTAVERKQAQAMLALHKQAAEWEAKNPMDAAWEERVQNLADNNVFNVASTGLLMLKSKSPLVRMLASELIEDASGAAGKRQATAAISKFMTERMMLGNAINDVQGAYAFWKKDKPGGLRDDLIGGRNWDAFNREIAAEIEARRLSKGPVSADPNIKAATDSLEAAYQRSANAQRATNTLGSEGLPETSVGYMPHRMSPKAVINMTNEQGRILHDALVDQFITIEGWDASFSDKLASTYMKRVRDRASGDYGSAIGGANPSTASLVEEALRTMDLPEDTIKSHMDRFAKGGAAFTKGRIELDLNKVYATETGEFKLLDIFETNQLELLRSQVGRASGEVALTKFGVRGKPGLQLLRDAMAYGEDGKRADVREKEAFDQMAAEFMNEPFGTQSGKFMERAMAANTLVRLGGIGFNQLAESINGIFHVGAARTMTAVASIPRLRQEIKALARGEKVDNPFLSSIELAGGAEFGTDPYKIVMPFDSPDHAYPTYGQDTLTVTDRLLRGGGHLQAKLSGWRMIHSAQQRGMSEQIVQKMARYVREGKDDIALRQFGITDEVQKVLKADLSKVATFDPAGNLLRFDVTKIIDPNIREQVIQAVWRGTSQIIQGTYIGERGKWAHDGWLKMMTQFRGFGITSMEKQWGRQRNDRGGAAAFGIMIGSMSIAAPLYMARTYTASIGRPDQEQFLEDRLQPEAIARATLNYIALSGMVGDFIDLTTAMLPESIGIKPTGGRAGTETDFVGNYVLPASSLVNDIWKYAQSPLEVDDAVKVLPMSRLPYMIPFTNATRD